MAAVTMPRISNRSKATKQRHEVYRSVVLTQADVSYFTELGSTQDGESSYCLATVLNQKLQLFLDSIDQRKILTSLDSASCTNMMIERVEDDASEMVDNDGDCYDRLDPPLSAIYFICGDEDNAGSDLDSEIGNSDDGCLNEDGEDESRLLLEQLAEQTGTLLLNQSSAAWRKRG